MAETPTTELEAVNIMLATIGEDPVSTLVDAALPDANLAKNVLRETSRFVQSRGWHFNVDREFELQPGATTKEITVPPNALSVDPEEQSTDAVWRGTRLYNRTKHTFEWDRALKMRIVRFLPFTDTPEAVRYFITIRAARRFQKRILGEESLDAFTEEDEVLARVEAERADLNAADINLSREFRLRRRIR